MALGDQGLIGQKIEVYWGRDRRWYSGRVSGFENGRHSIDCAIVVTQLQFRPWFDRVKAEIIEAHDIALGDDTGFDHRQLRLAKQNLLCLISELYLGHDEYRVAIDGAAHAAAADVKSAAAEITSQVLANAAAAATKAREGIAARRADGPDPRFVKLRAFKAFAMATFVVLISSAIIEGFFSQFAGLKTRTRNAMHDATVSDCMSTRVAEQVNGDPALAFNSDPLLADNARKGRLSW